MINILLIDGDILAYRVAWAVNREVEWDDGLITYHAPVEELKEQTKESIEALEETLDAKTDMVALTDYSKPNFRKAIHPDYKLNRKDYRKPVGYNIVVKFLYDNYYTVGIPGLEADDVLGIYATGPQLQLNPTLKDCNPIIVSIDKDMLTIPVDVYNQDTEVYTAASPLEAQYLFYKQILTGDQVDNYKGCPGVGPVTADKLLKPCCNDPKKMWKAVVGAFEKAGFTEDDALTQARLARILQREDFDYETSEPILWSPDKDGPNVS